MGISIASPAVDRNIMRLAIYEMLYREDIPPVVQHQRSGGHREEIFHAGQRKICERHFGQNPRRTHAPCAKCEMKFADLHLHTFFSDGTFSPEELAGHGRASGFRRDGR
ncbi:MAG: transcription antitermination factor NusB [Limisphaerales bacterium]